MFLEIILELDEGYLDWAKSARDIAALELTLKWVIDHNLCLLADIERFEAADRRRPSSCPGAGKRKR